jgi:hypothetical protein
MNISSVITDLGKQVKGNAPEILAALGLTGVVTTSYLTAKAAIKMTQDEDADPNATKKENVKRYWKLYIPPAVSGALTMACIVGSSQASGRRTAAAITAFSVTEKAFADYKDRVVDQVGKNQEQKIRDRIVQEKIEQKPASGQVIFAGTGHVLCCEMFTERYFRSDSQTLQKAQDAINVRIGDDLYVMLSEFYDLIGLPHTSQSDYVGWKEKPMELRISAVLAENKEPCLGFDYSYVVPLG